MASGSVEPSPRFGHSSAPVDGQIYLYGGRTKDFAKDRSKLLSTVYIFDSYFETWKESTVAEGSFQPGLYAGACASSEHHVYVYGGSDGAQRQGSLHQLNCKSMKWTQLSTPGHGPMRKSGCGLVTYGDQLVLFGGYGLPSGGSTQPGTEFRKDTNSSASVWSNELHSFNMKKGTWSSPAVSGTRPPPCAHFSLTKTDDHHVVLFGGNQSGQLTNDVYILDLKRMHWSRLSCHKRELCPSRRRSHGAVCLGYNDNPQLLVTGGLDQNTEVLNDLWLLDVESGRWREVKEPRFQARACHSAIAFTHTPAMTEVVLFGGCPEWPKPYKTPSDLIQIADTTVLRVEYQQSPSTGAGEWVLTDLADSSQLGTSQRVREKMVKMSQTSIATSVAATRGERMEEKDRRIQEAEMRAQAAEERAREAERAKVTAETSRQVSERNCAEQIRQSREQERRSEGRVRESEERLRECEEELRQVKESKSQWAVERREIQVTGPELGRGAWATVSVATFRGVRVAAKGIHNQIVSRHNIQLFKREMDMAARIRHPNLLQFIGATLKGEMVILTELMPTSLRAELQGEYMSSRQVTSIGLDVVRALNYLHLMQPHPFIHRDISSANVLLEPLRGDNWRAKVSDYGTVNLLQRLDTICPGNPTYAAPEANDPTQQSPKMDIFSFGALLVEMLTGELPASEERPRLLRGIHHQRLLALIRRCLSQNREDRPTASDIISELDH